MITLFLCSVYYRICVWAHRLFLNFLSMEPPSFRLGIIFSFGFGVLLFPIFMYVTLSHVEAAPDARNTYFQFWPSTRTEKVQFQFVFFFFISSATYSTCEYSSENLKNCTHKFQKRTKYHICVGSLLYLLLLFCCRLSSGRV